MPLRKLLTVMAVAYLGATQRPLTGISIPAEYAYLLPTGFQGNISENFIDTNTTNKSFNALLASARNATYYSYDEDFHTILGPDPTIRLIDSVPGSVYAEEAGIWISDKNEVWFTSDGSAPPTYFSVLELSTYTITPIKNTSLSDGRTPNGGTYFNGRAYFTVLGNKTISEAPGIFSVDPTSFSVTPILNSYYGVHLNSVNDVTWANAFVCLEPNMFFTTLDLDPYGDPDTSTAVLPNAVFRFNPSSKSLQAVIPRNDVLAPNGIAVDPSSRYLYVTDVSATRLAGVGAARSGSVAIYRFTLDTLCNPTNKVLFALPRSGIADGIHVDDYGRVWTAEYNGIVVRGPSGKELGVFNSEKLNDQDIPIANFALAGDKLVVLAYDRIWVVQLGQNVTRAASK